MTDPGAMSPTRPYPLRDRDASGGTEAGRASSAWLATGLAVALNGVTLLGVLVWHWPPGNVYLLFWVENAVLGVMTIPRVATARGTDAGQPARINGQPASAAALTVFFVFHYGLFCLVHLVFTAIVAYRVGWSAGFWFLGLPALLILVRYTVETVWTWFGPGGQRDHVSPGQAMFSPYPRIVVLHLAVLVSFALSFPGRAGWLSTGGWPRVLADLTDRLPESLRSPGVLAVLVLLGIKTVVDVVTTRRAALR